MDMASGKGQDLFRYPKNNIGSSGMLFLDIDKTALMELISRKHDFANIRVKHNQYETINVLMHQLDLTDNYKYNIQVLEKDLQLPQNGFDLIICNLAFHYLIKTYAMLINVIKFINHYLKPGGRFVFTSFDGGDVVNLLAENNGEWNSTIKGKYSIKKTYEGNALLPLNQKIKVLLPFSNNEYYEESLVNISYIEKEFMRFNIVLENNQSFSEFFNGYSGIGDLDPDDKLYTSLYHYYSFYKNKKQLKDK
jgi:SAM-dependent methyltransferase